MELYTTSYLKKLYNDNQNLLKESAVGSGAEDEKFDIFLSHSFLDREVVGGIYIELTKKGYKVYVDWIVDAHLNRSNVTKQTANLIRNRMKSSKSLLLGISTNTKMSKWMPWELGFVDGATGKSCIFPVTDDEANDTFERAEYLLLYPYLKKKMYDYSEILIIKEPDDKEMLFDFWLRKPTT